MDDITVTTSTAGFTKEQRLLTPAAFKFVFDTPESKIHQKHIMAFVRVNDCDYARVGMAITKRKVPTAVSRNLIKRQVRESFRIQSYQLKNKDIVFIIKNSIKDLSNKEIKEQINNILKKIRK